MFAIAHYRQTSEIFASNGVETGLRKWLSPGWCEVRERTVATVGPRKDEPARVESQLMLEVGESKIGVLQRSAPAYSTPVAVLVKLSLVICEDVDPCVTSLTKLE